MEVTTPFQAGNLNFTAYFDNDLSSESQKSVELPSGVTPSEAKDPRFRSQIYAATVGLTTLGHRFKP
jgi:hypothetical protein